MATDQAYAVQREVDQLVDLQIATLKQESPLTAAQLLDYHARFGKIQAHYEELDEIERNKLRMEIAAAPESAFAGGRA